MILFRSRLIFGIIKKIFSSLFAAVYAIISMLNLQVTFLVFLIGIILYLTGTFENKVYLVIFYFFVILSIVFSIYGTIKKLLGLGKKVSKKKNIQIMDSEQEDKAQVEEVEQQDIEKNTYPKYYKVRQRENAVMAEYEDRYELYEKKNGVWIKIRTDDKR